MARLRTIKPEYFSSAQVVGCSIEARLLFIGMWTFCDDQGIHPASPKRLKMEVFPGDAFTDEDIASWITELIDAELLVEFDSEGERYWCVTGWAKHQNTRYPTKRYPCTTDANSVVVRGTLPHTYRTPPARVRHRCGNGTSVVRTKDKDKDKDKELTSFANAREKPASPKRFTKPTLPEVVAYCAERRNGIDPKAFLDHYESNGWVIGKSPMRDWRAAVRTWERNGVQACRLPARASPATLVPGPGEELAYNGETGEDYVRKIPTRT